MNNNKNNNLSKKLLGLLFVSLMTFLFIVTISLSLITNLHINNGDANVRSDRDLICYFTVDQTTEVNVTWYAGGVQNLTASINCTSGVECFTSIGSGTVPSGFTIKGQTWMCNMTYYNGTATENGSVSVGIQDTPPTEPRIFYTNGSEIINTTVNITEDVGLSLNITSTDDDNDSITFSINDTTFCTIGSATGILSCTPTSESHLGIRILRIDASSDLSTIGKLLTINVTSNNDAPLFSPTLVNQNLTENSIFNYFISGLDYENNIPLNLSIYSISPSLDLTISRINNTAFYLMFNANRTATFAEASQNYTVILSLNDTDNVTNNSKNTTLSFQLGGITFNHLPNISYIVYNNNSLTQGGDLDIYINASDIDNSTLSFYTNSFMYNITYNSSTFYDVVINSSFAYAHINVTSMSNQYVITPNFTLYVYDSSENLTSAINMFITNTNDAPIIYEFSNHSSNSYNNTNLSNLIAYTGINFTFVVNATDIDSLTYDSANTGIRNYSTNDSSFTINSTTGILRFTPSVSGNYTFTINVTDFGGLRYMRTANISIIVNTVPSFNESPINLYCFEYDLTNYNTRCYYNLSAYVSEIDVGDYVSLYVTNSTFFSINSTTGIINFSANQTNVGNNSIIFNVTDSRGGMNYTTIYLIINNTNNPPNLSSPTLPQGNIIVGASYQIIYSASDLDLDLNNTYENLTFNTSINGTNTTVFSLTKLNNTHARLLITPIGFNYEGNYSINMTVTDFYNNYSSRLIYVYIYNVTNPPNITEVIPSGTPLNSSINNITWQNTTDFPGMITNITIYENSTYMFNQTSFADNSSYVNSLTYSWYYDSTSVASTRNYSKNFNFFSNGTHNLTIIASDQYSSNASFTWIINVTNINRPPTYNNNSLENLTLSGSGFIPNYLTYSSGDVRFYDPDDDSSNLGYTTDNVTTLVFSSTLCSHATFSFEQHRLNVAATSVGECYVVFSAADLLNLSMSVSSQIVLINITNISNSTTIVPVTQTRSSGGSSSTPISVPLPLEVEKPKPLQIITPKLVTTYKNSSIKIPIVINNTWNDTLYGITLEAETNASNVSLFIDDIYIPKLENGESLETTLYVSNYKGEGHYEIKLKANVSLPVYQDTVVIYINSAERNSEGEALESKISFAQDLLSSNPECQELSELLVQAKIELGNENYAVTAKIVDSVINGCKFLVNNSKDKEMPDRNFIKTFEWRRSYNDYLIITFFAILFGITLYYILKKDNPDQSF